MNAKRPVVDWLTDARHYAREARRISDRAIDGVPTTRNLAIRHCLMIVGEALDYVPEEILAHEPQIPWRQILRQFVATLDQVASFKAGKDL